LVIASEVARETGAAEAVRLATKVLCVASFSSIATCGAIANCGTKDFMQAPTATPSCAAFNGTA
jgi:hypothetical protein